MSLLVGEQPLYLRDIRLIREALFAQMAQALCGFLVQNVAPAHMGAFEFAIFGNGKSFLCSAVCFDFRHSELTPLWFCAVKRARYVLLILMGRQEHYHLAAF